MDEVIQILNVDVEQKPLVVSEPKIPENTVDADLAYARDMYYNIISQGKEALDGAVRVADLSQHPRAYEVVGSLLRNLAEVNKQLIDLANLNRATEERNKPVTVTNNVQFIGTSADLNKMIADKLEKL
jgi:hypothetical protein